MGNSQINSEEKIKSLFHQINFLCNPNSLFEKDFLIECENIKKILLNEISNGAYLVSKKYKNICNFQNKEDKKENFLKWYKIILSIFTNFQNSLSIKKNIEKKLRNLYKKEKKEFLKITKNNFPKCFRSLIWIILSEQIIFGRKDDYYNYLKNLKINYSLEDQIEKDIYRTFKEEKTNNEINKLKNILIAFTNLNNDLGYCQGMNFIAGFLLKICNYNEIDTFYLFCFVLEKINGYFMQDFPLFNYNLYLFNNYFKIFFPKLEKHFKEIELPLELWIGKWIQTLFIISLPFEETCRIWDYLFIYGFDFIILICLGIIFYMEDDLLIIKDSSDVMYFFKESFSPKDSELISENIEKHIIPIDKIIKKGKYYFSLMNKDEIKNLKKKYEEEKQINITNNMVFIDKLNLKIFPRKSFSSIKTNFDSFQKLDNKLYFSNINLKTEVSTGIEIDELSDIGEEVDNYIDENREGISNRILEIKFNNEK